jgi:hypothetical protein
MTGMQSSGYTRYSVGAGKDEVRRQRSGRVLLWALIAVAGAVIVVFAFLIVSGGLL